MADGSGAEEVDVAERGAVFEDGGTGDDVVEMAGLDGGFLVGLVLGGAVEEGGHEQVPVPEGSLGVAAADAHHGDADEAANVLLVHGGDDGVDGVGFEGGGFVGGGAADGVDDGVLAAHGSKDVGGMGGVSGEDADVGAGELEGIADEDGEGVALGEGSLDDQAAGLAGGTKDEKVHGGSYGRWLEGCAQVGGW